MYMHICDVKIKDRKVIAKYRILWAEPIHVHVPYSPWEAPPVKSQDILSTGTGLSGI